MGHAPGADRQTSCSTATVRAVSTRTGASVKLKTFSLRDFIEAENKRRAERVRLSGGRIESYSVWVYFMDMRVGKKADWILKKAGGEEQGGGRDMTSGEMDVSYTFREYRKLGAALRALAQLPGIRVELFEEPSGKKIQPTALQGLFV